MPTRRKKPSLLYTAVCHDDVIDCGNEPKYQESDNDSHTKETLTQSANICHPFGPNPLLNSVVIKRLFQYLKLDDLKNLRFVCQEWNSVAQPLLRKRAKIVIKRNRRGPVQFLTAFRRSSSKLPFTHFVFSEECDIEETGIFFSKYGENITSFKCESVTFLAKKGDGGRKLTRKIKMSLWANCNNLSDLHVNCTKGTKHFIPIEDLANVKNLTLENCTVILKKDFKLSPSSICLLGVTFLVDITKKPELMLLNNAFDFRNTTTIHINQSRANTTIIDVSKGIVKIEKMTLFSISIVNWKKSQWIVDYLFVDKVNFIDKITIIDEKGYVTSRPSLVTLGPKSISRRKAKSQI